ncbi:MAG TPA: hypothetical protein VG125_21705 [Pirellulales bacterium]|jgi:hypothetical protein|nr:hypothetical protein [Pirellulales bacterium]
MENQEPKKSFDVALVDPHNPAVEHWPRARVTVGAASVDDLPVAARQPPPGGESAEAEAKRLAFLVSEIERGRAIAAYDGMYGLTTTASPMLRYDVVPASGAPPQLSQEWADHLGHIRGK